MDEAGNPADTVSRNVTLVELSLEEYARSLKIELPPAQPECPPVDCQHDCKADIDAARSDAAAAARKEEQQARAKEVQGVQQQAEAAERKHRQECTAAVDAARSDTSRCPTVSLEFTSVYCSITLMCVYS
jgi:hypothetical protein